jgi:hypothetical protein
MIRPPQILLILVLLAIGLLPTTNAYAEELPDGRVYEMVTPVHDLDGNVYVPYAAGEPSLSQGIETTYPFQAASDGNAVTYIGDASIGGNGSTGKGVGEQYLARRLTGGGWQQTVLQPAAHIGGGTYFQGFSRELATGVVASGSEPLQSVDSEPPLAADVPRGYYGLYTRDDFGAQTGPEEALYQPLFTNSVVFNRNENEFGVSTSVTSENQHGGPPAFAGESAGGLFFEANDDLTAGDNPLRPGLDAKIKAEIKAGEESDFLYESVADGVPNLVSVLPDGEVAPNATFGAPAIGNQRRNTPDFDGVISPDGRWVYWTDEATGTIFVRVGGSATVQVSAGAARYWTSAGDGRYAFYVEGGELFRYDAESGAREPLTAADADVQGVLGASEDGEDVYAVTSSILAGSGASGEGALPVKEPGPEGLVNLYLLPHGGSPVFIATLSAADGRDAEPMSSTSLGSNHGDEFGDWQAGLGNRTAGVSADGVAFMSNQPLPAVGFPNGYPGHADQVYMYQPAGNQLFCVSCSSSNAPQGGGVVAFLPVSWSAAHRPEWVADGGNRVFFDSEVPLVPQDTNGRQDVYEWEHEGTGGCTSSSAVNGGCVYLLSGGTGEAASWFIGASESGGDVFIASRAQLTPEGDNEAFKLFDARVGGVRPVSEPFCTGTGCQGPPEPAPIFATPASVTFTGVGNFSPPTEPKLAVKSKSKAKPLTRRQKLTKALRSCSKQPKAKRARCEARARGRFAGASSRAKR